MGLAVGVAVLEGSGVAGGEGVGAGLVGVAVGAIVWLGDGSVCVGSGDSVGVGEGVGPGGSGAPASFANAGTIARSGRTDAICSRVATSCETHSEFAEAPTMQAAATTRTVRWTNRAEPMGFVMSARLCLTLSVVQPSGLRPTGRPLRVPSIQEERRVIQRTVQVDGAEPLRERPAGRQGNRTGASPLASASREPRVLVAVAFLPSLDHEHVVPRETLVAG